MSIEHVDRPLAESLTTDDYEDIGSLVGTVELIGSKPTPYFLLREQATETAVPVYFTSVYQHAVLEAYRRRVEVFGRIRYDAAGTPLDVRDIGALEVLPLASELRSLDSFIGAIPDMTGGLSVEEYMDRIRGRVSDE